MAHTCVCPALSNKPPLTTDSYLSLLCLLSPPLLLSLLSPPFPLPLPHYLHLSLRTLHHFLLTLPPLLLLPLTPATIRTLHTTVYVTYPVLLLLQIIATTGAHLAVFWASESKLLLGDIATPLIPWHPSVSPSRRTQFFSSFLSQCILCPLLEEFFKYLTVITCNPTSSFRSPFEFLHPFLAVSVSLKLLDAWRRIALYGFGPHAAFYAVARGLNPLCELCGALSALRLARARLLNQRVSVLSVVGPSVLLHGIANFKGKVPLLTWHSVPWRELMLTSGGNWGGFAQLTWLVILVRVTGYVVKQFYILKRVVKRKEEGERWEGEVEMGSALKHNN